MGKTSLIEAASACAAAQGFAVLHARGSDLERDFSFGCVRQLLEATANGPDTDQLFTGAAGLAAPLLRHTAPTGPPAGPDAGFPMLHGLYWLVANLAETRPVLLTVDDCHWADPASVRFLGFLASRLDGLRALLVLSCRPRPDAAVEDDVLARVRMAPGTVALSPRPLTRDGCEAVIGAQLGAHPDGSFVDACHRATAGNPLYLALLLRQLAAGDAPTTDLDRIAHMGPEPVAQSVMLTVAWLHPAAASCVRALAVLGDGSPIDAVTTLAGRDASSVEAALDALRRAGLVTADDRPGFSHPVVREAVYGDMSTAERRRLHTIAADLLRGLGAEPERVAAHLLVAGPESMPWAGEVLTAAAGSALMRGDPGPAIRFLEPVVAVAPDPGLLHLLGLARLLAGRTDATDVLQRSVANTADWAERTPRVEHLAAALHQSAELVVAEAVLREHLEAAPPDADADTLMMLEAQLLGTQVYGDRTAADALLSRIRNLPADTPGARALLATAALATTIRRDPDGDLIPALIEATLAILREHVGAAPTANLLYVLVARDAPTAGEAIERVLANARLSGSRFDYGIAIHFRARLAHRHGDLRAAEADARAALAVAEATPIGRTPATSILVDVQTDAGMTEEARREIGIHAAAGGEPLPWMRLVMDLSEARLLIAEGRPAESWAILDRFRHEVEQYGSNGAQFQPWRQAAVEAKLALGDLACARELAEEEHALAARSAVPTDLGVALRLLALTDSGSVVALEESADLLRQAGARLELARTWLELGRSLARSGQRVLARERLEDAHLLAEDCRARPLAARAKTELAGLGVRPRGRRTTPLDALTAGERQVCELAATGLSNPEIAQALFVTRKTVETHLGHAYRKLGISGRGQLPDALRA